MKRFATILTLVLVVIFACTGVFAAVSGTKNVPGDYPTLAAAIADLNAQGVGEGGVTINVLADNPVTSSEGGLVITTQTATEANPIVIQGNGNKIVGKGQRVLNLTIDSIIKITGGNITVNGFVTKESGGADQQVEAPIAPISAQSSVQPIKK